MWLSTKRRSKVIPIYVPFHLQSQVYRLADSNLCLVGTAEVTLSGMYAGIVLSVPSNNSIDRILPVNDLPIKMVGFSHCFRVEVGNRGQYVRGLYRVVLIFH